MVGRWHAFYKNKIGISILELRRWRSWSWKCDSAFFFQWQIDRWGHVSKIPKNCQLSWHKPRAKSKTTHKNRKGKKKKITECNLNPRNYKFTSLVSNLPESEISKNIKKISKNIKNYILQTNIGLLRRLEKHQ